MYNSLMLQVLFVPFFSGIMRKRYGRYGSELIMCTEYKQRLVSLGRGHGYNGDKGHVFLYAITVTS